MEKETINQNIKHAKELHSYTTREKIDFINADDVEQSFRVRFRNDFFLNYFEALKHKPFLTFNQEVNDFFENQNTFQYEGQTMHPDLFNFYKAEKSEMEAFMANKNSNPESRAKAKKYLDYLTHDENRWWRIDDLYKMVNFGETYASIAPLAKAKMKKEFINISKLDNEQSELFRITDRTYLMMLLSTSNLKKRETYIERFPAWFDFDYYKEPYIFVEFPKEKNTFHKILKSWIIDQVETRKKVFEWDEIPPEYQYLLDYANSLLPITETEKPNAVKPVATVSENLTDYPRHIFADAKAYELFALLMQYFKTHNAISFIFRTMAEKEKPQLILVNDTPFRAWFNNQEYPIQLENHTKTYDNAKNEDRIAAYRIAKDLTINK